MGTPGWSPSEKALHTPPSPPTQERPEEPRSPSVSLPSCAPGVFLSQSPPLLGRLLLLTLARPPPARPAVGERDVRGSGDAHGPQPRVRRGLPDGRVARVPTRGHGSPGLPSCPVPSLRVSLSVADPPRPQPGFFLPPSCDIVVFLPFLVSNEDKVRRLLPLRLVVDPAERFNLSWLIGNYDRFRKTSSLALPPLGPICTLPGSCRILLSPTSGIFYFLFFCWGVMCDKDWWFGVFLTLLLLLVWLLLLLLVCFYFEEEGEGASGCI